MTELEHAMKNDGLEKAVHPDPKRKTGKKNRRLLKRFWMWFSGKEEEPHIEIRNITVTNYQTPTESPGSMNMMGFAPMGIGELGEAQRVVHFEKWIGTLEQMETITPESPGCTYFAIDKGIIYRWDGTQWGVSTTPIMGYDGENWVGLKTDSQGRVELAQEIDIQVGDIEVEIGTDVSVKNTPESPLNVAWVDDDAAILVAVRDLLGDIKGKDFASETTLADVKIKLETLLDELELITLGQGKILGHDGTNWVAVKVDEQGRLETSQEIDLSNISVTVDDGVEVTNTTANPVPISLPQAIHDILGDLKAALEAMEIVQGRMLGHDGTGWKYLRVDDEGRIELSGSFEIGESIAINNTSDNPVPVQFAGIDGGGLATEETLDAAKTELESIKIELEAVKTELETIQTSLTDGTQIVQVSGTIPEYQWLSTDTPPVLGATDRAFGVEMDTTTHEMTIYYWTGSAWQVKK